MIEALVATAGFLGVILAFSVLLWLVSECGQPPGRRNFGIFGYLHFIGFVYYETATPDERKQAIVSFVREREFVTAGDIRQHLIDRKAGPYNFIHGELDAMPELRSFRTARGHFLYRLAYGV